MTKKECKDSFKTNEQIHMQESSVIDIKETIDYSHFVKTSNLWISAIIDQRIQEIKQNIEAESIIDIPEALLNPNSPIGQIMQDVNGAIIDFTLIATALTSKFYENFFSPFVDIIEKHNEIGGIYDKTYNEFIPTLKTIVFLLSGYKEIDNSIIYQNLLSSRLFKEQIIELIPARENRHAKNAIINLNDNYFNYIVTGKKPQLGITPDFPAQQLITSRTFDELILKDSTKEQLEDIILYAKHYKQLQDDEHANKVLKQGFIGLFWGPPGTGKSLTASVIGNELGIDVYRVDLSRLVSKYIGETEKNLERVFQRFDGKNCILFFDEADSLFGKRSQVKDAKDRYANQEISYLLQRVEAFSGLVILASNLKENMDDAFKRRVLSWTYFPRPEFDERLKLWNIHLPQSFSFESEEMILEIAERYALTGAYIANVVKLSCLRSLGNGNKVLTKEIIEPYIVDIYNREGVNKNVQRTSNIKKR